MTIDKDYAEEIRESLSARAFEDEASFRAETQNDVNAGYYDEVEHVGRLIFGRAFAVRRPARTLAHKCATGASDTADTDLQRPAPTRHATS